MERGGLLLSTNAHTEPVASQRDEHSHSKVTAPTLFALSITNHLIASVNELTGIYGGA